MKKGTFKKNISYFLVTAFTFNGIMVNLTDIVHATTITEYTQNFDNGIDGIEKILGGGTISSIDGALNVQAGNWPDQGNYTLVVDENSPSIKDGVIELDVNVKSHAGRLGIVFRYQDEKNYTMVGYDIQGKWILKTVKDGTENETILLQNGVSLDNGKNYKMKIVFLDSSLELYVNNNLIYSGNSLTLNNEGKIGFRQWGYTDNYSNANYDNISYYSKKPSESTEEGHYLVSFDDNDVRGWEVATGDGAIESSNGKLTTQANGNNSNTISFDKNSPSIKDGFVETNVTVNNHAGRFALLFRYENSSSFAGIGYDVSGNWVWLNGSSNGRLPFTKELEIGKDYKIGIKYAGEYITVLIDGEKVYEGMISGIKTTEGKIGVRNWGYTGNYSNTTFDYFINGKFNAVNLNPNRKFVPNNEAGEYDVQFNIEGDNELEKLFVKDTDLVLNQDYTIADKIITIKKSYIEKVKNNGDTDISLLFKDGYVTNFKLQVQLPPDESNEYLRDFSKDGIEGMNVVSGQGKISLENGQMLFNSNGDSIVIDENSPELYNSSIEFVVDPKKDSANIGAIVRYSENGWTYIGQDGSGNQYGSNWYVQNSSGQRKQLVTDSTRIYANRVEPYKIKIKVVENTVTIYLDGAEIYNGVVNELTRGRGKSGLRLSASNIGTYQYLAVNSEDVITTSTEEVLEKEIKSNKLSVKMDDKFPRVIDYTYLENNKKMYGQEKPVYLISINNKDYTPKITSEFKENEVIYKLSIDEIKVNLDVRFTVEENVLTMKIENIDESNTNVETINFPNHSLVSVRNTDSNAEMNLANYESDDIKLDLTNKSDDETYSNTSIAILSSDDLAASIKNNSIKNRQEINYQTFVVGDHYSTGLWTNEYLYRGLDGNIVNEPYTKVTITADRNSDSIVDYQDGAIALRDDISEKRLGVDLINDSYSSVAMNVGSNAQYPFLRILDNIKKFNLSTDGFEQTIIIKGYQGEGHDSNHPDFANISERAGGLEDFQTLLKESENYNANIGVHINHTEAYPEAEQYGPDLVSSVPGWSWYDSANQIIRENDILDEENGMAKRLEDLVDEAPGLDLVYIDVYMDGRWPAHMLTSKLNDLGLAVASEYAKSLTKTSVWAHHAYNGGYGTTSELARFVNHTEQDIFGGNSLFRGNSRIGINGWQNESDLNATLSNFFTSQLPFKYLMNYSISKWEDNSITFGSNNEVVSKVENGVNVITKDGKNIAVGNKIFIPWDVETEEKIYHWNDSNDATTWELPESWKGSSTVYLYELSDLGKINEKEIKVSNNKVKLEVKKNTGYVLYKGKQVQEEVEWSTGAPIGDMGFDSHSFDYWEKTSTSSSTDHINIVNNKKGNSHIRVEGNSGADAEITQLATGLKGGQSYSASVWFEVSDDRKATLSVLTDDGTEVSNYTDRTNVLFGVKHTDKYGTNYQRVKVNFTVPEGTDSATIKLKADSGSSTSWVNIDDVRIMKVGLTDQGEHYLFEDFENVDFGFGPFVSTGSDNSHLSQTNAPYTDDTIGGEYSLKIRSGDYMRTIPATVRFKPNTSYVVGFDYIGYKDLGFTASIKSDKANEAGDKENSSIKTVDLNKTTNGKAVLEFTTGDYDDYYLEIKKNNDTTLIVDNLFVDEIINVSKDELKLLIDEVKALNENDYTKESFANLKEAISLAEEIINKENPTEEELRNAYNQLKKSKDSLVKYASSDEIKALESLIKEMKDLKAEDYKQDNYWEEFQKVILKAEELIKRTDLTSNELKDITNELHNAKNKLVHANEVDKNGIKELLEKAQALKEEDYVQDKTWQDFKQDITEAIAVIESASVTQEEVDFRYNKLKDGYDNIIPINKPTLEKLINEANEYKSEDYTEESFNNLLDQIESGNKVLENNSATRLEVENVEISIKAAINNLVAKDNNTEGVDKTELVSLVEDSELLKEEDYTAESWESFINILNEAKTILSKEDATQEEVNNIKISLEKAIEELEEIDNEKPIEVDKIELKKLIAGAEALKKKDYTKESWESFRSILKEAKAILSKKDATQEEVNNARNKLRQAISDLKENDNVVNNSNNHGENNNKNNNGLPNTGGISSITVTILGTITTLAGSILYRKKK